LCAALQILQSVGIGFLLFQAAQQAARDGLKYPLHPCELAVFSLAENAVRRLADAQAADLC
jgi:hypothetical protein